MSIEKTSQEVPIKPSYKSMIEKVLTVEELISPVMKEMCNIYIKRPYIYHTFTVLVVQELVKILSAVCKDGEREAILSLGDVLSVQMHTRRNDDADKEVNVNIIFEVLENIPRTMEEFKMILQPTTTIDGDVIYTLNGDNGLPQIVIQLMNEVGKELGKKHNIMIGDNVVTLITAAVAFLVGIFETSDNIVRETGKSTRFNLGDLVEFSTQMKNGKCVTYASPGMISKLLIKHDLYT